MFTSRSILPQPCCELSTNTAPATLSCCGIALSNWPAPIPWGQRGDRAPSLGVPCPGQIADPFPRLGTALSPELWLSLFPPQLWGGPPASLLPASCPLSPCPLRLPAYSLYAQLGPGLREEERGGLVSAPQAPSCPAVGDKFGWHKSSSWGWRVCGQPPPWPGGQPALSPMAATMPAPA